MTAKPIHRYCISNIPILIIKKGMQLTVSSHPSDLLKQFCQIPYPHPRASQVVRTG